MVRALSLRTSIKGIGYYRRLEANSRSRGDQEEADHYRDLKRTSARIYKGAVVLDLIEATGARLDAQFGAVVDVQA